MRERDEKMGGEQDVSSKEQELRAVATTGEEQQTLWVYEQG